MRQVRTLVNSYEGMPDDVYLDKRARLLTIGDMRELLRAADQLAAPRRDVQWPEMLGDVSRGTRDD